MPRKIRKSKKKSQKGGWGEYTPPLHNNSEKKILKGKKVKTKKKSKKGGGWGQSSSRVTRLIGGWGGCSTTVMKGGGWGSPSRNVVVDISSQTGGFKRFLNKHF